jgi:deazaflavin-dependent oxidoreductase (nitroreductase family)
MAAPKAFLNFFSRLNNVLYRASKGRIGGTLFGVPTLLLTTTGNKTGKKRTTPLLYARERDDLVVVASVGGRPQHPGWYFNLLKDPKAVVQIKGDVLNVTARVATDAERPALWEKMSALYPGYLEYQKKTTRQIPILLLRPDKA